MNEIALKHTVTICLPDEWVMTLMATYDGCFSNPNRKSKGALTLALRRAEKRKVRRFGGRWVERKLHRHKNGRDNLSYVWREWWKN